MEFKTFRKELRALLIEGRTQEALEKLLNVYEDVQGDYYDEVIVLSSRMRRLRDKSIAGAINSSEANSQANDINHSLLQIIDDLHNDKALAQHFGLATPTEKVERKVTPQIEPSPSPTRNSIWKTLVGVLVGVILAVIFIKFFTPATTEATKSEPVENEINREEIPSTNEPTERINPPDERKTTPVQDLDKKGVEPFEEETTPNSNPATKNLQGSGEQEPNNSLFEGNKITVGRTIEGIFSTKDDVDVFTFNTSASYRNLLDFKILPQDKEMRLALELYNDQRESVGSMIATNTNANLNYTFSAAPNSTYLLKIYNYYGNSGKYNFSITPKANIEADITEKENNDTAKKANELPLDFPLRAFLHSSFDKDYYRILIPNDGRLKVKFTCQSQQLRGRINVFDENNNRILQHTANGPGANFKQEFTVKKGTYLLIIEGYQSDYGDYVLEASL